MLPYGYHFRYTPRMMPRRYFALRGMRSGIPALPQADRPKIESSDSQQRTGGFEAFFRTIPKGLERFLGFKVDLDDLILAGLIIFLLFQEEKDEILIISLVLVLVMDKEF